MWAVIGKKLCFYNCMKNMERSHHHIHHHEQYGEFTLFPLFSMCYSIKEIENTFSLCSHTITYIIETLLEVWENLKYM